MSNLCGMCPEDLTLFATAISAELARDKSFDEILVLKNFTALVSQMLFTIASQREFLKRNCGCDEKTPRRD